jgi:hypothetical protein
MKFLRLFLSLILIVTSATIAQACDLCGCYTPQLEAGQQENKFGIYAGIAEQFTHFGTDLLDGHEVANPTGEYLNSSITQLVIGTTLPVLDNRLGVQVSLPFIDRDFKRPDGFAIDRGNIFGFGDMSLIANFIAFRKDASFSEINSAMSKEDKNPVPMIHAPDFSAIVNLTAGIKLPTGDTSRLKENFNEVEIPGAPDSGIGGHDLTLGTGSVDAIFGAQALLRYKALFFQADAQYTYRTKGDYQYRFANDFSWSGGPGFDFIRRPKTTVGLQFVISGETKGYDEFEGQPDTDTGVTSLFLGPRILASAGRWNGEVSVDLPVIMNTTSFQTAPTYRVRAGFSFRF